MKRRSLATVLIAAHLAIGALPSPTGATEQSAEDRKIADAGREGRELLRELQRDQAANHDAAPGDALKPSAAIKRQAAKLRSDIGRDADRQRGRSPADGRGGVNLSKGICVGCLK
ncbi:hypothetical protein ASF60_19775 [Methylobacterium sp. Leaf113]|nr:hypothetical protein ASF60_19775 [Methylobacterium sp. Leaf113]